MSDRKPIVFSGIQPTGQPHLGNYIGAIRNWAHNQDLYDNIFCIVDLHAITIFQEPAALRAKIRELAGVLLACGIDPQRSLLFVQSWIPAHSELAWILTCHTPVGWLERMTQYKDKAAKQESIGAGLLNYPVLQAADILLYDTHFVPVGEDQRQHIELTRDIASRFNHLYGDVLVMPEALISEIGARVMGLDDPTTKMSKSIDNKTHAIGLLDDPDEIQTAIRRAVTDWGREIAFTDDPEKAGVNNLLTIYQALSGQPKAEVEALFAGQNYGYLKSQVAEIVVETLRPVQARYRELTEDPATLDATLAAGAEAASAIATRTLQRVQAAMGIDRG